MNNSIRSKQYWKKIIPIIIWHFLYLIFSNTFDKYSRVYLDLVFYLGIACYFFILRDWRFSEWRQFLKTGKKFWIPVIFTILGMAVMFGLGIIISILLPNINDGMAVLGVNNWLSLVAFAIVTIFLPPISEEIFYRKAIIAFDSKKVLFVSILVSIFIFASEHSLMPIGFFTACLWAIPLSIAYIKTKNIYISMTAHFLCNFFINGITVITSAIALLS
jgi:membrane protease YdiL (CAAX protease family)